MFTAWGTIPDAVEAMRRGAVDYLEKQAVNIEQLVALLRSTSTPETASDPRIRSVLTMIAASRSIEDERLASSVEAECVASSGVV